MTEVEWTSERLREIVEARWPAAIIERKVRPLDKMHEVGAGYVLPAAPAVLVIMDTLENANQAVAAAVCAPDLWALVEAAREWQAARDDWAKGRDSGTKETLVARVERMSLTADDLGAALARVEGEEHHV